MKKTLVLLALTLISTTSFAQDYGNITLSDGNTIFRIDVGNDREADSRRLSQRVNRLERAVRDLQNRIYDLEDNSRPTQREVTIYTCVLPTSFIGTYIGKAQTVVEARAQAVNSCSRAGGGISCQDSLIDRCEKSIEIQR